MATSSHEHHDNRCTASNPRAKCYGSGHCLEQTIFHARLSRHSYMRGQHARLSFVADDRLQHARHSYVSSIARSIQLSQRRACRLSPLVPTRIHDHWLRFLCLPTGRTNSTDILWTPRARPVGALCILDCACSLMACNLGFCPLVRLSSRSRSS